MQNTNEFSFSSRRGKIVKAIVILATVCLFALIFGQSITKSVVYDNTTSSIIKRDEQGVTAKRRLTHASKSVVSGDNVYVRIGGKPIGIAINAGGLIVIGESEVPTSGGTVYPARNSGIEVGDVIVAVGGKDVTSIYQLKTILDGVKDEAVSVTVLRDGAHFDTSILPAIDRLTGQKKLGLMLKEDVGGVGTLTFVTQDGRFGALGHYIADGESGLAYELTYGNIYKTSIDDIVKGERGKAGGLVGDVNRLSTPIGKINMNTNIGLFGEYTADYDGELYRIAEKGEAKPGAAKVYTTIEGSEPKFYDIDIVKVVSQSDAEEKGIVIAVRDKELLEKTGGIVQGMSGSPIVQDGILIGAVTHVFVQDPTRGYAVHSRFMYDYATSSKATTYECGYCEGMAA